MNNEKPVKGVFVGAYPGDEKNPYCQGWFSVKHSTVYITQPCHSESVLQLIQDVVAPQWISLVGMIRKNPSFQGRYDGRHVWHHSYRFSGIGPNNALNLDAEVWRLNNLNSQGNLIPQPLLYDAGNQVSANKSVWYEEIL